MVGHYVFNASAIGLGGVLTTPRRKVIPSLASVHLAPTGGEGSAIVTNYDEGDGITFDRAETRVWGSSHSGNIYATRADVMVNNLDVFHQLQVESMWASVTSIREVLDNGDVLDRRFEHGEGAGWPAALDGVDEHQCVVPVEQAEREMRPRDTDVDHLDAVPHCGTVQAASHLAAERIVLQEDVPDSGDEDPAHTTGSTSSGAKYR